MDEDHRRKMKEQMYAAWRLQSNAPGAGFLEVLEDSSGGDSSEEDAADEQAEQELVPVGASLLILLSAIVFGGSIFSVTEGWSFFDAVYYSVSLFVLFFCFGHFYNFKIVYHRVNHRSWRFVPGHERRRWRIIFNKAGHLLVLHHFWYGSS